MAETGTGVKGSARWSLKGKTALVTGGTRGIGHAVVEELAGFGASVYTCSRNEAELGKCLKEWEGKGFVVSGSVCDASSRAHRERLLEQVASVFNGKLNILINNVGTNIRKPTIEYTAEEYSTLMATNFESTYHLCQLAHPLLKASGMGSIVFISSVAGLVSIGSGSIYAASKGESLSWYDLVLPNHYSWTWQCEKGERIWSLAYYPQRQLTSLQKIWLVNGQNTISGPIVLHPGIPEPRWWNTCLITKSFWKRLSQKLLFSVLRKQRNSHPWWHSFAYRLLLTSPDKPSLLMEE